MRIRAAVHLLRLGDANTQERRAGLDGWKRGCLDNFFTGPLWRTWKSGEPGNARASAVTHWRPVHKRSGAPRGRPLYPPTLSFSPGPQTSRAAPLAGKISPKPINRRNALPKSRHILSRPPRPAHSTTVLSVPLKLLIKSMFSSMRNRGGGSRGLSWLRPIRHVPGRPPGLRSSVIGGARISSVWCGLSSNRPARTKRIA